MIILLPGNRHAFPPLDGADIVRAWVAVALLHRLPAGLYPQRIARYRVAHNRVAAFFQRRAKHINDVLAAPRRDLAHRRIINLYAVLSGRPLRANLSLRPLLTALTLRASITLGANRASFANRPLRAGIALLALYTLNALLTFGAALSGVAILALWASRASCTRCPGRALNSLFSLRPLRAYGASPSDNLIISAP